MREESETPVRSQALGDLKATYHMESPAWKLIPGCLLLLPLLVFGVLPLISGKGLILSFIFGVPLLVLLYSFVSTAISERKDELRIHQNGFTYQSRKGFQSCLWGDIEDYEETSKGNCVGVKKANGTWISFGTGMEGLEELNPYLRKIVKSDEA